MPIAYSGGIVVTALFSVASVWVLPVVTSLSPEWSVTFVGGILACLACLAVVRVSRRAGAHVKGVVGERMTADALDSIRGLGYEIFHDLPDQTPDGHPCNIDHIIVGPGGVFVVETKFRQPAYDGRRIAVLPEYIQIDGVPVNPDPRHQALAALASVRNHLDSVLSEQTSGLRAVVVFPRRKGGGVENAFKSPDGVWVLTPLALAKTLRGQRQVLSASQVRAACAVLQTIDRQNQWSPTE